MHNGQTGPWLHVATLSLLICAANCQIIINAILSCVHSQKARHSKGEHSGQVLCFFFFLHFLLLQKFAGLTLMMFPAVRNALCVCLPFHKACIANISGCCRCCRFCIQLSLRSLFLQLLLLPPPLPHITSGI